MPGDNKDHLSSEIEPTQADVFSLIGHELRAEIIRVLGATDGLEASFSELRSQLDMDVKPSQLHYHLQQLVGHFVVKSDGGYRLSAAGIRLCLTLRAGTFNRRQEQLSVDANVDCYYCRASVEATFDNGFVDVECPDCKHTYGADFLDFPLTVFEDEGIAFSHFKRYIILKNLFIARGVCPNCTHPLSPSFNSGEDHPGKVCIYQLCGLCGLIHALSVGRALLADPELIMFCYDNGVDVFSTPWWELKFVATDEHVTVRSTDPWEVALEVTFDGDTLELVIDGDLNVLERNRLDATPDGHPSLLSRIQSGAWTTSSGGRGELVILPDNADCLEYLRHHRWSDGVTCPSCERQDTIKKGTTGKDAKRYRCQNCGGTFNDLTGTTFADHRFTLAEMFYIIRQMDETTTVEIARQLDRSSESVSDFVREVRDAQDADTVFGG